MARKPIKDEYISVKVRPLLLSDCGELALHTWCDDAESVEEWRISHCRTGGRVWSVALDRYDRDEVERLLDMLAREVDWAFDVPSLAAAKRSDRDAVLARWREEE